MLISFLTLILSFCIGILSGLFFRKRVPNFLGEVLRSRALAWACVIGAFTGILATYIILKFLLWIEVIGSVNTDWFIRQCIWLTVLSVFGVILSGKAFKDKPTK